MFPLIQCSHKALALKNDLKFQYGNGGPFAVSKVQDHIHIAAYWLQLMFHSPTATTLTEYLQDLYFPSLLKDGPVRRGADGDSWEFNFKGWALMCPMDSYII